MTFMISFSCVTKVLLNEKETNSVPAFTMCLKQDKSNSGLAMVPSRPVETAVSTGEWSGGPHKLHCAPRGSGEICCSQ